MNRNLLRSAESISSTIDELIQEINNLENELELRDDKIDSLEYQIEELRNTINN